ncbi:hypothetical protein FRB98_005231 [Tulasnella sp. 332]|nr:hypothetical protein FRB98_005231 [Tulasnella sp. 332]
MKAILFLMLFAGLVFANINITFSIPNHTIDTTGALTHQASNLYIFGIAVVCPQFYVGEVQGSLKDSYGALSSIANASLHTAPSTVAIKSDGTLDGRSISELGDRSGSIHRTVASYTNSIIDTVASFDWSLVHETVRLASAAAAQAGPQASPAPAIDSPTVDVPKDGLAPVTSTAVFLPELVSLEHVVSPSNSSGNYSTLVGPTATPEQLVNGISSTDYRPRTSGSYICYRSILVSTDRLTHGISVLENPTTGQTPRGFRRDGCDWRLIDTIRKPAAGGINTSQAVIDGDRGVIALASFTFTLIHHLVDLFARIAITIVVTFAVTAILRAAAALRRLVSDQRATIRMLRQELEEKTSTIHKLDALAAKREETIETYKAETRRFTRSRVEAFLLHVKDRTNLQTTINNLKAKLDSEGTTALARIHELETQVEELELGEADEDMDRILLAIEANSFSVQRLTVRDLQEQLSTARAERDGLLLEKRSLVSELSKAEETTKRIREARERLATEYALLATASQDRLEATGAEKALRDSAKTSATGSGGRLLKKVASRIPGVRGLRRSGDK